MSGSEVLLKELSIQRYEFELIVVYLKMVLDSSNSTTPVKKITKRITYYYYSKIELQRGASLAQSSEYKRLSPPSSWVRFSLRTHVKKVSQRSAESRGFSTGAPVSSHRES